jgi:hypothetical protein
MSKTPDSGKDEVARLCQYFATNQQEFFASGMKEAHVRQVLIDPFLEALGWDVRNTAMAAPQYREVIPEDSLDVEGHQKAPDYTFRVGTLPKFYVEAKKCGVNLHADPAPAYQLRRYGWSAKVAVSLLTDFEELGVYDCTSRPRASDKASRSRIQYFRFEEYADRWRELWDVFSREAVWSGAFDQYAASKRSKRGTSEVDIEFLQEIERWRDALARNIAIRNKDLSSDDLNAAVQRTIDRVVFLRMAEDRGLEPYEQLLKTCDQPHIYARFMRDLCRKADDKYNSGLFHFRKEAGVSETPDHITPNLTVDDKVLRPILQSLYFAHGSPYHFGVLPVEILGTVYERFLGKVIRLTAGHQAKIEDKPEVRKAGGVYYTPAYIVDYIVKATVGSHIGTRSPAQLAGGKGEHPFRVLDMACGSGSFLLGAYQFLLDHCLKWYVDHKPATHRKAVYQDPKSGAWRLTNEERKRILTTHLFGVDLDPQAVEVSKLSLLLKALEGENDATLSMQMKLFHARALPNLSANIKCGNSLIGPDIFAGTLIPDPAALARVNAFDWGTAFPDAMKAGGFDCIIGNPPYIRMETFKDLKSYLKATFACHDERSDLYAYFIERAHKMLTAKGRFGMIVSNKFLRANYGRPLREFLHGAAAVERVVDFAGLPVFQGATVRTIVLLTTRPPRPQHDVLYSPPISPEVFQAVSGGTILVENAIAQSTYSIAADALGGESWSFGRQDAVDLLERLHRMSAPLKEYCAGQICRGVVSGLTDAFVIDADTRAAILKRNQKAADIIKPFLNGRDVRRYIIAPRDQYLIYTHHGVNISDFPAVQEHLQPFKGRLEGRATQQPWYELQQPQQRFAAFMDGPKIIFPDIATSARFALDEAGFYCANTAYFIPRRDLYLLGLLNSKLGSFYFARTCAGLEGKTETYLRFFGQYMERFPVRRLDLSAAGDKAEHDRMVKLVESMLSLHGQLAAARSVLQKDVAQRQLDATDAEIDRLVYGLYGLTGEEIDVVGGAS